jgi:hypothetical protein
MKRKALALILILALLFSAAVGTVFVNLAKANPFPTYPVISIESPTNKTYTVTSFFLNVTLVTQWDGLYFTSTRRLVSYCIDGKESIPIAQTEYKFDSEKQASIWSGSAVLADLGVGTHNLRVNAEYDYENGKQVFTSASNVNFTIDPNYSPSLLPSPSTIPTPTATPSPTAMSSSEPTLAPEPEPFPVVPVATTFGVVAVVAAGLLVYFKKSRREAGQT